MLVLSADLSTKCTGIVVADINKKDKTINKMLSTPILPRSFDIEKEFGYMKSKKKLLTKENSIEVVNTYCFKGEKYVSKREKEKRDIKVRQAKNLFILTQMSKDIGDIVKGINPDLILYEKNSIFNGILTIELLAKLAGTLVGIAGSNSIPIKEYKVQVIRKKYNPTKLVKDFIKNKSKEYIASLEDVTKEALKEIMVQKYGKYGLQMLTCDESDACVVFDDWYEEFIKNRKCE